jgi:hypothetical protein
MWVMPVFRCAGRGRLSVGMLAFVGSALGIGDGDVDPAGVRVVQP